LYEREKRKKKRYYFHNFGGESKAEKMVKSVILVKKWKNRNVFRHFLKLTKDQVQWRHQKILG